MACYLCGSSKFYYRMGEVRDDKSLKIKECQKCSLVYLSDFSHIDEGFYEDAKMHESFELQKWNKETDSDDKRRFEMTKELLLNKDILDFGSGNGGYLHYASSLAKSISAVELQKGIESQYEHYGITLYRDIDALNTHYDLITMFHLLEHLVDPKEVLTQLYKKLKKGGKIIIEVPNSDDALLSLYRSESFSKFTRHSQYRG